MDTPNHSRLPLEQWNSDMQTAVDNIFAVGKQLLSVHRGASPKATEVAVQWNLEDRLEEERQALNDSVVMLRGVLTSIDAVWCLMNQAQIQESQMRQSMRECAKLIGATLPSLQRNFLTIRHCALDLLRWSRQFAEITESDLPDEYRASYARLLAYTPIFRPALESLQSDLLQRNANARVSDELQELLSQLTHYMAAIETVRAFLTSVVSPPMDLVFQDTHSFHEDWTKRGPEEQGLLATELNDHCQLLLYDAAGFHAGVQNIQHSLPQDLEAALYVLAVNNCRIVFSMDEDPVFRQIIVTLLRVVEVQDLEDTIASLLPILYRDFSGE